MNSEEQAIATVLQQYEAALNASDTDAVMKLYTADGIFMPQHFPSSIGTAAVRLAYDGIFTAIRLTVKFAVQEVHAVAPDWAFARTNSAGHVTVHAKGESSAEANQELFVMQKIDGQWKIARYCFCTTNPPRS
ncbi:MAG: YybH family protein [Janthinobacterium lividum]